MLSVDQAHSEGQAQPREQATIRGRLQEMWSSVAPAWQQHAEFVNRRSQTATERLIDLADLRHGDRVLELACGPGGLGLEAAHGVGPGGEVVLSDIAEPMTQVAIGRAQRRGLTNVTARP